MGNNDRQMGISSFRLFLISIFVVSQLFTQLTLIEGGQPDVVKGQPNVIDIQTKIPQNE